MKKVTVVNSITGLSYGATLEDPTTWIADQIACNSWGLPERWLPEYLEGAETKVEDEITYYKWPCEYTIAIVDLENDPDYIKEQALQKAVKYIEFGKHIIALAWYLSSTKNMSIEDTYSFNTTMAPIITLLNTGSLETAAHYINAIPVSTIITQNDKDAILTELNAFLGI